MTSKKMLKMHSKLSLTNLSFLKMKKESLLMVNQEYGRSSDAQGLFCKKKKKRKRRKNTQKQKKEF